MEAKQKAIKDHYIKAFIDSGMSEEEAEAKWNEIQPIIGENGYISQNIYFKYFNDDNNFDEEDFGLIRVVPRYRPKSLNGIESNRGWKSIEDGLPEDKTHCWFIDNKGEMYNGIHHAIINEFRSGNKCFGYEEVYYWQPITKPNLPLY